MTGIFEIQFPLSIGEVGNLSTLHALHLLENGRVGKGPEPV